MNRQLQRSTHCTDCGRKFRPNGSSAKLYPGQPVHYSHNRCPSCNSRLRSQDSSPTRSRAAQPRPSPAQLARMRELDALRMGSLIIQRARFEASRARRGIPTTGLPNVHIIHTNRLIPTARGVAQP